MAHLLPPLSAAPGGPAAYLPPLDSRSLTATAEQLPHAAAAAVSSSGSSSGSGSFQHAASGSASGLQKPPPRVLEQLAALLSDGELDGGAFAGGGAAGSAAGGVTAVSATGTGEPTMLMDIALHHVLAPLLEAPAAGDICICRLRKKHTYVMVLLFTDVQLLLECGCWLPLSPSGWLAAKQMQPHNVIRGNQFKSEP